MKQPATFREFCLACDEQVVIALLPEGAMIASGPRYVRGVLSTRFLLNELPKEVQRERQITVTEKMLGGIRWIITVTATENQEAIERAEDFMAECLVRNQTCLKEWRS